jgi:hypothetical protein
MFLNQYDVDINEDFTVFEFQSIGKKGVIQKIVIYEVFQYENLYNLGFGDLTETKGIDDKIITDNGDSEKVLATVAFTLYSFTDKRPDALVLMKWSTESRTRLYQIAISKYLIEIQKDFIIHGYKDKSWYPFEKNEKNMINQNQVTNVKKPVVRVNPSLDKYLENPVFVEKIAFATEIVRTVGLPKEYNDLLGKKISALTTPNKTIKSKRKSTLKRVQKV